MKGVEDLSHEHLSRMAYGGAPASITVRLSQNSALAREPLLQQRALTCTDVVMHIMFIFY